MQFKLHSSDVTHPSFAIAKELLWTLSPQAIFLSFSPRLSKITGWGDADWLGKPLQSFIHPGDIPRIKARFGEALGGDTLRFENVRCLMKDGSYLLSSISLVPQTEGGKVTEILALGNHAETNNPEKPASHPLNSLKLHRENEQRLTSSIVEYAGLAKLLEGMLGNAPIGFALLDEELRFICLNHAFAEMTSFSPSQQLGHPLRDFLPKVADLLEPVMRSVLSTGESLLEYEVELPETSGIESSHFSQMSFYPIPDLHGGACGVATIAVDITDRKIAEAKLRKTSDELLRSNVALERFSYVASHDLKEPLRTISSFVQLLRDRYKTKLDKDADEYIARAIDGAKRMQLLIDKILDYSRAGKVEQRITNVNCTSIVQGILDGLRVALDECGAKVTYESLPVVRGDEMLLNQVFQNLIANALKYRSTAEPEIQISAKRELNTWIFSVADNGIGISSDQFVNVFAPFKKLHSQNDYAGSGLGLAICQKNVERQGGRIWVTSALGKGSVFSFTIPALSMGEASRHEALA